MTTKRTAALLVALVTIAACGKRGREERSDPERESIPVESRAAAVVPVAVTLEVTGNVEPWIRVSPGAKILGRIVEVTFREGDPVRSGKVMVELEKRDLEAAARQARAAVGVADAQLGNARAQHDRMNALHARGSVTDKNLEDATSAFRIAEAQLEQARSNLAAAEVAVDYATIRSPVSGFVVHNSAEVGGMAVPGAPLFTVEDLSRVKVIVQVPESDVVGIEEGAPARVLLDVLDEAVPRAATVDRVVPAGDPSSRTYRVQLVLDNPDGRIKSGMFARAWFERGRREALLVPHTAVVDRGQLRGIYVVGEDDVARLRWVRTGRMFDDGVELISGLEEGERFVVSPPPGLADGSPVVVTR